VIQRNMGDETYTVQLFATRSSIVTILLRLLPLARAGADDFPTPRGGAFEVCRAECGAERNDFEERGTGKAGLTTGSERIPSLAAMSNGQGCGEISGWRWIN